MADSRKYWICPSCSGWSWASRSRCYTCQKPWSASSAATAGQGKRKRVGREPRTDGDNFWQVPKGRRERRQTNRKAREETEPKDEAETATSMDTGSADPDELAAANAAVQRLEAIPAESRSLVPDFAAALARATTERDELAAARRNNKPWRFRLQVAQRTLGKAGKTLKSATEQVDEAERMLAEWQTKCTDRKLKLAQAEEAQKEAQDKVNHLIAEAARAAGPDACDAGATSSLIDGIKVQVDGLLRAFSAGNHHTAVQALANQVIALESKMGSPGSTVPPGDSPLAEAASVIGSGVSSGLDLDTLSGAGGP